MKTKQLILKAMVATALLVGGTGTANAQFGNILNKAKDKVVNNTKNSINRAADKAIDKATQKAKQKAYKTITKKILGLKQMPELPWTMAETTFVDLNRGERQGMTNAYTWLLNCGDISNQEMATLRDQMKARYSANSKILLADETGGLSSAIGEAGYEIIKEVKAEQARYWEFYGAIKHSMNIHAYGIKPKNDHQTSVSLKNSGLVCDRTGGGFGIVLGVKNDKGRFLDLNGNGTYLEDNDLETAKYCARRMLNYGFLLEGVDGTQDNMASLENIIDNKVFGESGYDTDWAFETNRAAMYAKLLAEACASNDPSNIERQPMPKAGAMNGSLKAAALKLAKAEDSSVINVVITSKSWNVVRNALGIPTHRTVTGYWIRNSKHGKQAVSRSWCQDHIGGGRYSVLRNFGVGTSSPIFLK